MKTTLEVELQPFKVPDFVLAVVNPGKRQDGMNEPREQGRLC